LAAAFLAGAFFATTFFAGAFLATAFFADTFLAAAFLAGAFLAGVFFSSLSKALASLSINFSLSASSLSSFLITVLLIFSDSYRVPFKRMLFVEAY
jgi:hypothetical protein